MDLQSDSSPAQYLTGMLLQQHTTVLPNGKEVTQIHPVEFSSKQTSQTKEKYKPYLLEFAALKFSLDKFTSFILIGPSQLVAFFIEPTPALLLLLLLSL
jgi:hypothetical protein